MKVAGFEILVLRVPLRPSATHEAGSADAARTVLVAAHDAEGHTGWGETCPRPTVSGETVDTAREALRSIILPVFLGRSFDSPEAVARAALGCLDGLPRNQHAAFAAAELALLDLAGRAFGLCAGDLLGPVRREHVEYGGVIAATSPAETESRARALAAFGASEIKVGVGPDLEDNLQRLGIVREILGSTVELRVDAKGAWSLPEAIRQLEAMAEFRIAAVEQPVPAADLQALRELTAAGLVPVVADESLVSLEDARRLVDRRACDVFNVRIAKVGGLLNAGRIHRCARAAGLDCQLGAHPGESGLLAAAGRHYATRAGELRWLEGGDDSLLLSGPITTPDVTAGPGGWARPLAGPGLGVVPDPARLDACTLRRFAVT